MSSWADEVRRELELAQRAREQGNEGRARVCARRAGGAAAREFLSRSGEPVAGESAYDLLNRLSAAADIPAGARRAAELLALRVDEDFKLPPGVDLIQAARDLARALHPRAEL